MAMNIFFVFLLLGLAHAGEQHPFTVLDNAKIGRIGGPWPSPDGLHVVYSVRYWNSASDKTTVNLWIHGNNNNVESRQLTHGENVHDTEAAFSPDSKVLAFLSDRSGSNQLWAISVEDKNALPYQVTDYPVSIDSLKWSSDGGVIGFSAEVYPDHGMHDTAIQDKKKASASDTGRTFDRLYIRHWGPGWFEGKFRHLHVLKVRVEGGKLTPLSKPVDIMPHADGDTPSKPWGGAEEYNFSPDGTHVAYSLQLGRDQAWSTDRNVYVQSLNDLDDLESVVNITPDNTARDHIPSWSIDGRYIAYLANRVPQSESDSFKIKLYDTTTKQTMVLTEDWDRSIDAIAFDLNTNTIIYCLAADQGMMKLWSVDFSKGVKSVSVRAITKRHAVTSIGVTKNSIFFAMSAFTFPTEICIVRLPFPGQKIDQLTYIGKPVLTQVFPLSLPESVTFIGAEHETVQAFLFKPVNFNPSKKYSTVLYIHGGPEAPWEDVWSYRWNPQTLTGAGYAVFAINFHGSPSFGDAFTKSILKNWGIAPFEDLQKGVAWAEKEYSWIDNQRWVAMGASYGGFMINYINGNWPDKFKALVCHDGIFNGQSFYYDTDELYFPEQELGGPAFLNSTYYDKFNPAKFIKYWKTPTLVIHGSKDWRIPDTHGIGAFASLQRMGVPSKLLLFSDENHWVVHPFNSIRWHNEVLAWLDRWSSK